MTHLTVNTFEKDSEEQTFRKIFEELYELTYCRAQADASDWEYANMSLMMELGDLVTAIFNWARRVNISLQDCVDLAETKNILRGYYDTIE